MSNPLIALVSNSTGRKLFLRVSSMMHQLDLKGSFLFGPPDLDNAYNYACTCINELHSSEKRYAHRPFQIERGLDEITIVHIGAGTGKRSVVCQFKKIK